MQLRKSAHNSVCLIAAINRPVRLHRRRRRRDAEPERGRVGGRGWAGRRCAQVRSAANVSMLQFGAMHVTGQLSPHAHLIAVRKSANSPAEGVLSRCLAQTRAVQWPVMPLCQRSNVISAPQHGDGRVHQRVQ